MMLPALPLHPSSLTHLSPLMHHLPLPMHSMLHLPPPLLPLCQKMPPHLTGKGAAVVAANVAGEPMYPTQRGPLPPLHMKSLRHLVDVGTQLLRPPCLPTPHPRPGRLAAACPSPSCARQAPCSFQWLLGLLVSNPCINQSHYNFVIAHHVLWPSSQFSFIHLHTQGLRNNPIQLPA